MNGKLNAFCIECLTPRWAAVRGSSRTHNPDRRLKCSACGAITQHAIIGAANVNNKYDSQPLPPVIGFKRGGEVHEITVRSVREVPAAIVEQLSAVGICPVVVHGIPEESLLSRSAGLLLLNSRLQLEDYESIAEQAVELTREN